MPLSQQGDRCRRMEAADYCGIDPLLRQPWKAYQITTLKSRSTSASVADASIGAASEIRAGITDCIPLAPAARGIDGCHRLRYGLGPWLRGRDWSGVGTATTGAGRAWTVFPKPRFARLQSDSSSTGRGSR
jgi:hypothetical protein